MKYQLLIPMALYVFYIFILSVYNLLTRLKSIQSKNIPLNFFKTYQGDSLPERVIVVGRHYDNQFQVPMVFLITCLVFMVLDATNQLTVYLAWAFVVTRFGHSFIHLGSNYVRHRVVCFALGWFVICSMWIQLCCEALRS